MREKYDPVSALIPECKDSTGQYKDELIRCALESAYRIGYKDMINKLPSREMDNCPVRPPQWPVDEAKVATFVDEHKDSFLAGRGLPKMMLKPK